MNPLDPALIGMDFALGRWQEVFGWVSTLVQAEGSSVDVSARARLDVELIGIYDKSGWPFAYRQLCVASGTPY